MALAPGGQELKTAELLTQRGIELYLPTYRTKRKFSNRPEQEFIRALFPGYIFIHTDFDQRFTVLQSGVRELLRFGRDLAVLSNEEITNLKIMATVEIAAFEPAQLTVGQWVEVIDGPLKGMTGVVDRTRKNRITVNMPTILSASSVEIEPIRLRAVKEAAQYARAA